MKVGIILTPYGEKEPAGLGAFVLNLTLELVKQKRDWDFLIFIKGVHDTSIFDEFENVTIKYISDTFMWKDVAFLRNRDVDIWLYNNPSLPIFFKPQMSVLTALDFGIFYTNESSGLVNILKLKLFKYLQYSALKKVSHVLCTSSATKNDLHSFFPSIMEKKVTVVMCGFTRICEKYDPISVEDLPSDYYLVVGVIKPRKNQITAVKAFILAKENGLKGKLVICGKGASKYFNELIEIIQKSDYKDDISYLGYCSNGELVTLYKNARALIFPSKVEGFGMPVVEAMSCGVPVITSSNGALGEVAEGYALTVESSDVEGFSDAIRIFEDDLKRDHYIKIGLQRANEFSWEKSAQEYAKVLGETVSRKKS